MADATSAQPSRGRWYVLLLISVMYLITYLDRVNISTAAPQISKEFGFDKVTMGFIFSAFVWAYALFQVPGGWLSDRFGARGVLTGVVAYWSIMTAATAAAFSDASFIVIQFLFGIGEAGAFPGATRAMQLWYSRWAVPMDTGGKYSGTVSGMMNMSGNSAVRSHRSSSAIWPRAATGRRRLSSPLYCWSSAPRCGRSGATRTSKSSPRDEPAQLSATPTASTRRGWRFGIFTNAKPVH